MEDDIHVYEWGMTEGMSPLRTPSDPNLDCSSLQFNTSGLCQTNTGTLGRTRSQAAHSTLFLKNQDHINLSSVVFSGDSWHFRKPYKPWVLGATLSFHPRREKFPHAFL